MLARAHHGSVSKDQRSLMEEGLKTGRLRCVVATSSLELHGHRHRPRGPGHPVGLPPSAASGLQRVGRAGHRWVRCRIGESAQAPRGRAGRGGHRGQMLAGNLEHSRSPPIPGHPGPARQVSAVATEAWTWRPGTTPCAAAPVAAPCRAPRTTPCWTCLPGGAPPDEFAQLRRRSCGPRRRERCGPPRCAAPGDRERRRPDRGLFPRVPGGRPTTSPKRVGELDEEMVYSSRVGDITALGASSWRWDRPRPGGRGPAPVLPAALPFSHGTRWAARGAGARRRALHRELAGAANAEARERLAVSGLDVAGQPAGVPRGAARGRGRCPEQTARFMVSASRRLGDWRVVLRQPIRHAHHVRGRWPSARRLDGAGGWMLALRPRTTASCARHGRGATPGEAVPLRAGGARADRHRGGGRSALRVPFRENAARALLLPRADPGKRTPLWQQRSRQLLDVAGSTRSSPIILETRCASTSRTCTASRPAPAAAGPGRAEAAGGRPPTDPRPSPLRTLLFGTWRSSYTRATPAGRAQGRRSVLDPPLLNELLGPCRAARAAGPEVIETARPAAAAPGPGPPPARSAADLLRLLGPVTADDAALRLRGDGYRSGGVAGCQGPPPLGATRPRGGAAEPDARPPTLRLRHASSPRYRRRRAPPCPP
ncbi:hypothetical protein QJS66_17245 [Kocuria rhizophila]|nr:hypothetical protein QJS66_17245 [Kocuria rhizophila]